MYPLVIAIAVFGFLIFWSFVRRAIKIFKEVFIVYSLMAGGQKGHYRMSDLSSLKTYVFIIKTSLMDEAIVDDVYRISSQYFDMEKISRKVMQARILHYDYIILIRDRNSGTLRGTAMMSIERKKGYTLIIYGGLQMDRMYRGDPYLHLSVIYYTLKELILHPFTPLYGCLKIVSYQGYLHSLRTIYTWPRYNQKTPDDIQKILCEYGRYIASPTQVFNEEAGVLEEKGTISIHMKDMVADIEDKERLNPHVKFFEEKNPGWAKGDSLLTVAQLDWSTVYKRSKRALGL